MEKRAMVSIESLKGKRICPICDKVFIPNMTCQIVCSAECSAERKRRIKAWKRNTSISDIDYLNSRLEEILDKIKESAPAQDIKTPSLSEIERYRQENAALKAEMANKEASFKKGIEDAIAQVDGLKTSHRQKLEALKKEYEEKLKNCKAARQSEPVYKGIEKQFLECKRMRLRAFNLPCGLKRQCFEPNTCGNVPAGMALEEVEKREIEEAKKTSYLYQ